LHLIVSVTFNVSDLSLFDIENDFQHSRTNAFQEDDSDVHSTPQDP